MVLLVVLFWVFRAIGLTTLNSLNTNLNVQVGEIIIEFFSFILALYLSIKSFYNEKPLKVTLIVLSSFFIMLLTSVVITKILLNNDSVNRAQQTSMNYIVENPKMKKDDKK